jgi:hypothetical protein
MQIYGPRRNFPANPGDHLNNPGFVIDINQPYEVLCASATEEISAKEDFATDLHSEIDFFKDDVER